MPAGGGDSDSTLLLHGSDGPTDTRKVCWPTTAASAQPRGDLVPSHATAQRMRRPTVSEGMMARAAGWSPRLRGWAPRKALQREDDLGRANVVESSASARRLLLWTMSQSGRLAERRQMSSPPTNCNPFSRKRQPHRALGACLPFDRTTSGNTLPRKILRKSHKMRLLRVCDAAKMRKREGETQGECEIAQAC